MTTANALRANGTTRREVKVAMDCLRTRARRRERFCTNMQIKIAGLAESPQIQAALGRLRGSVGPVEVGLLRLRNLLKSPTGQKFLMGAGTGAALGATGDALSSPEDGKHHYARSALLGGAVGAGVATKGFGLLGKNANAPATGGGSAGAAQPQSAGGTTVPSMAPRLQPEPPPPAPQPSQATQPEQAPAPGTQLSRPGRPGLRRVMQMHAAAMQGRQAQPMSGMSFTPRTSSPSSAKLANLPGAMAPAPAAPPQAPPQAPGVTPAMQSLMQGQSPTPPKTPMQILHELPAQLTNEMQTRQQQLHTMLGDAQVPLADKLTALGKMLKGLPEPPKDPLDALRPGGMAQPMAPKMAGAMDTIVDSGKGLVEGLRGRLADPATRTQTAALVGAGLGGAASLTAEASGKRSNKRYLNALLTGAGAGAMLGGGAGYISNEMGREKASVAHSPSRDPKIEAAASGLLGQLPGNPSQAAEQLNKLTVKSEPTLGDYTSSMVGAAGSYAPMTALTAGGLAGSDLFRGIRGYYNAIKFQNRSQLNTDPTHTPLGPAKGWKDRFTRLFNNPNYQSSMLHRVDPSERIQQAADHLADNSGLGKFKDRIKSSLNSRLGQDALLRDASQLPKALGHDAADHAAKTTQLSTAESMAKKLEDRMARLKALMPQRELQIQELESSAKRTGQQYKDELKAAANHKSTVDPATGARTTFKPTVSASDVSTAEQTAAKARQKLAKLREKLVLKETSAKGHKDTAAKLKDDVDYGKAVSEATTPEKRHSLIQSLNNKADAAHPELTPVHESKIHNAHRRKTLGPASLTHRAGRTAVGLAGGLDTLRMLAQYLTPTEE